eukprot:scaffold1690_cov118-Isochrysis_galbana.AAC.7
MASVRPRDKATRPTATRMSSVGENGCSLSCPRNTPVCLHTTGRPPRSAAPSLRALPFALPAGPPPWRCAACRAPSRPARVANSLTVSAR